LDKAARGYHAVCDTGSIVFHTASVLVTFAGPVDRRSVKLIFTIQGVKDMSVRMATLLEFDGIDTLPKMLSRRSSCSTSLSLKLKTRATKSDRFASAHHFHPSITPVPIGIGSDGDEKARPPEVTYNRPRCPTFQELHSDAWRSIDLYCGRFEVGVDYICWKRALP